MCRVHLRVTLLPLRTIIARVPPDEPGGLSPTADCADDAAAAGGSAPPPPEPLTDASPATGPVPQWSCDTCTLDNDACATVCAACRVPRPDRGGGAAPASSDYSTEATY